MHKLIVIDNRIIGTTTPDDPNGYVLVDPPADFDGDLAGLEYDPATGTAKYSLDAVKLRRIAELKRHARDAIESLAWRIERAEERERLGVPGETVEDVLVEREAIRRAAGRAEIAVLEAKDVDEVRSVVFAVADADRVRPRRLSRLMFSARFTDEELAAIYAAAKTDVTVEVWLDRFKIATDVDLDDPRTRAGVQALEAKGLLAEGRAQEILA